MNLDDLLCELRAEATSGRGGRAAERFWEAARAELDRFFSPRFQDADRDDLAHMCLLVIMRKVPLYEQTGPDSFRRWLWAIGARVALEWLRMPRADRFALSRMLRELSASGLNPDSCLVILEQWDRVVSLMPELSDNDREILEHDLAEGSDADLARARGITTAAVSMRRKRARERARRRLLESDK